MSENANHRATLLIGYGRFGLETLRQFLTSTATRGVLAWDTPAGPGNGERRLRDLGLLWLPDPFEDSGPGVGGMPALDGSRAELMRDLHQQIENLPDDEAGLKQAVKARAEALLRADTRASRDRNLPLGLDVVVLAHPHDRRTLGRLRPLLKECVVDVLYRSVTQLHREVGADALNFVQILDFANYWERSEPAKALRGHFKAYVEHWQRWREEKQPTFGRIYLVDSHTPNGVREERLRIDEISLFLEFLLFEGQRDSESMQTLYQARPDDGRLLATFGIRLLERSGGLLKRLAAARFGIGWLEYLDEARTWPTAKIQPLRDTLEACQGAVLEDTLTDGGLPVESHQSLARLAGELEALPADDPAWPQQVRACCAKGMRRLESELADRVQLHIRKTLQEGSFADLAKSLRIQIDAALHDDRQPATLGTVVRELESALDALKPNLDGAAASAPLPAAGLAKLEELQAVHQDYRHFLDRQLDMNGVLKWWPLLAFMFGLGLSHWLSSWIAAWLKTVGSIDPTTQQVLSRVYDTAIWLVGDPQAPVVPGQNLISGHPWALALASLLLGAAMVFMLHRAVKRQVLRARLFWTDPERGRLADALRVLVRGLTDDQAGLVAQMQSDAAANIRDEAGRELGQWHRNLRERRREMGWLRSQLHDFLDMHGLDADSPVENWTRISRDGGIRHAMEQFDDLLRISQTRPPIPEHFQSMQAEKKPFKKWEERYSQAFLYPLRFIDELSENYQEPLEQELAQPGSGAEQLTRADELCAFLRRHSGDFTTAFRWKASVGVPPDSVYCLLPPLWLGLPGVRDTLTGQAINEEHRLPGEDVARAYLLRLQIGVETTCLTH